jgi:carboxypeptidase Q
MWLPTLVALALQAAPDAGLDPSVAPTLITEAVDSRGAYGLLSQLIDATGPRLSGSPGADRAVTWAVEQFQALGLDVRKEAVRVPVWVRGVERGEVLGAPGRPATPLALTALGGSPGTPPRGVEGNVVEVSSLAELRERGAAVKDRVVFFNHSMSVAADYKRFGELRSKGPAEAAKLGAVAALVRSLATASLRSPHTGSAQFPEGARRIPAAAISLEDAELLHHLLGRGPVRVRIELGCRNLPDATSFDVVAELRGRERPEEVVLMGAHLDSWDLATGAQDDGAGVALVVEAARLLAKLPLHPRRTVRFVLFMNEENGLRGAKTYAADHGADVDRHVAAMELDSGSGRPLGVAVKAGPGGAAIVERWLPPLVPLGAGVLLPDEAGGADLTPLAPARVPVVQLVQDTSRYFDIHHSAADTLDKVDREAFSKTSGAATWLIYALAESPEVLPRPPAPPPTAASGTGL